MVELCGFAGELVISVDQNEELVKVTLLTNLRPKGKKCAFRKTWESEDSCGRIRTSLERDLISAPYGKNCGSEDSCGRTCTSLEQDSVEMEGKTRSLLRLWPEVTSEPGMWRLQSSMKSW